MVSFIFISQKCKQQWTMVRFFKLHTSQRSNSHHFFNNTRTSLLFLHNLFNYGIHFLLITASEVVLVKIHKSFFFSEISLSFYHIHNNIVLSASHFTATTPVSELIFFLLSMKLPPHAEKPGRQRWCCQLDFFFSSFMLESSMATLLNSPEFSPERYGELRDDDPPELSSRSSLILSLKRSPSFFLLGFGAGEEPREGFFSWNIRLLMRGSLSEKLLLGVFPRDGVKSE